MAERIDRRAIRRTRRAGSLKPGRYFLVHSDQLYSLEPVADPFPDQPPEEPLGPLAPDPCPLEPPAGPQPGYGPEKKKASTPTGFFLDRYVY